MESGHQFVHAVKAMRDAQVKYFMTQKSSDLKNAKKHEAKVDDFLRSILKRMHPSKYSVLQTYRNDK
tara:strand:+ start:95 stop:295 length:201 start_codon:yes stop_codon:yes gene_type:complete